MTITYDRAIELLKSLIRLPSLSGTEQQTATLIADFIQENGIKPERIGNNVVAVHSTTKENAPWILLNSHHDTVPPCLGWSTDPFQPVENDGRIYGLGSNDAGGALVTILATFINLSTRADLPANIMFAATAEEETSGDGGMAMLSKEGVLDNIDFAIIGEPTGMNMAIAERGLMVLECTSHGVAAHAAGQIGDNAIYKAMRAIEWFRSYDFERYSHLLGKVKMTVTQISAGTRHNVVPDECRFVVDVRIPDTYEHEEILDTIQKHVEIQITPRSLRLRATIPAPHHPLYDAAHDLGITTYGSPTLSDMSLMPSRIVRIKIGPGESARSHTANEWIGRVEIDNGIKDMEQLIQKCLEKTR